MTYKDSHKKSVLKSIIWRILGVIVLASVVYFYTRQWITTGLITLIHHGTFLLVFYLHERAWLKIKTKFRSVLKAFTYEIILGMGLGGLIVLLVTGEWSRVTEITITYTALKLVMYYFYEKAWCHKKVVYAYVCGDILHIGHLRHLKRAAAQGTKLIVGVLTDEAVMEKKPKPIIPFDERLETIEALIFVDLVVPQTAYSPLENVKKYKPDILMESTDHDEQPANEYVESYGGKVIQSPYYLSQSSTKIKEEIKQCK